MALKDLVRPGPAPRLKRGRLPPEINLPVRIDDSAWFYIEQAGINIVHEIRENGRYIRTDQFTIRWASIERALRLRPPPLKPQGGYRHGKRRTTAEPQP